MDLLSQLSTYNEKKITPLHMPGHKRAALGGPLPWGLDITEIDGFDNLHGAEGILKASMDRAARVFGAERSFYLVNGSTCGILAGICAAAKPGDKVLLQRGCHKAVYHGLELRGLVPVYLDTPVDEGFGVAASLPPGTVEKALAEHPDGKLLILTCPTYEGVVSDLSSIVRLAHSRGVAVLVDAAHGAHLGFSPAFPASAVTSGADVVIQSLHKTLPSLTQTAIAHIRSGLVDAGEFARQLSIFETSSPSYLLLGSMDFCVRLLEEKSVELFTEYEQLLAAFDEKIAGLRHLRVLCHGGDSLWDHPGFFAFDPGKLVISTRGTALTGPALMERLRQEYGMELEMALGDYALSMTSICDSRENLDRLADALVEIDGTLAAAPAADTPLCCPIPPQRFTPAEARLYPTATVPLDAAVGRIAGEMVWAYPPGIPLLVLGEEVTEDLLTALRSMETQGVRLHREGGDDVNALRALKMGGNS